eukprot:364656-Chlamydomonas_euryale.AAC.1
MLASPAAAMKLSGVWSVPHLRLLMLRAHSADALERWRRAREPQTTQTRLRPPRQSSGQRSRRRRRNACGRHLGCCDHPHLPRWVHPCNPFHEMVALGDHLVAAMLFVAAFVCACLGQLAARVCVLAVVVARHLQTPMQQACGRLPWCGAAARATAAVLPPQR